MNRDQALSKIKKCLALGCSAEPHEAAAALRRARKLMAEFDLSDADVSLADRSAAGMNLAQITLDDIRAQCVEEGDCWIWRGDCSRAGYPRIYDRAAGTYRMLRRVVYALVHRGRQPRHSVTLMCNCRACLNPQHMLDRTTAEIGRMAAKRGSFSRADRCLAIARAAQARSPLTLADVKAILVSDEAAPTLAARYRVSKSAIYAIRRRENWRTVAAPGAGFFSQLGGL